MHDIVIRHGDVVDGTGAGPVRADIAIDGDRITEVGVVTGRGERELDASGRIVTPGFVDIHTHLDAQLFWDPAASSSCWHGVTTVVLGFIQRAHGYDYTLVNGTVLIDHDELTDERPGRLVTAS